MLPPLLIPYVRLVRARRLISDQINKQITLSPFHKYLETEPLAPVRPFINNYCAKERNIVSKSNKQISLSRFHKQQETENPWPPRRHVLNCIDVTFFRARISCSPTRAKTFQTFQSRYSACIQFDFSDLSPCHLQVKRSMEIKRNSNENCHHHHHHHYHYHHHHMPAAFILIHLSCNILVSLGKCNQV